METERDFREVLFCNNSVSYASLRWSLLTILRESLLCIIDNRCGLVRHFLICLLCEAVIIKLKEENKKEEGFKTTFKKRLRILAAPYPVKLVCFLMYFSPGTCVLWF